ncbi:MAG: short chain dehydrogenase [Kribbellaceae bacterium]|nr:short chain dehydrogenase [Kribbellaceae bacterium]
MGEWDGQVAIVTGAASGIGSAIVEAYLEEGARVLLADHDERALLPRWNVIQRLAGW